MTRALVIAVMLGAALPAGAKSSIRGFIRAVRSQEGHQWDRSSMFSISAFRHYRRTATLPTKDPQKVLDRKIRQIGYDMNQLEKLTRATAPAAQRCDLRGSPTTEGFGGVVFGVGGGSVSTTYHANRYLEPMAKCYARFGAVTEQVKELQSYAKAHPDQPQLAHKVQDVARRALKAITQFGHHQLTNRTSSRHHLRVDNGVPDPFMRDLFKKVEQRLLSLPDQVTSLHAIARRPVPAASPTP